MRNPTGGKGWCRSRGRRHESDERAERAESGTDERCLIYERRETPGDSVPRPLGFNALLPIQSFNYDEAGATPALTWFWPRSRRSGCFPAEPYSPLRSLVVYLNGNVQLKKNQKWGLTSAALSDMDINTRHADPSASVLETGLVDVIQDDANVLKDPIDLAELPQDTPSGISGSHRTLPGPRPQNPPPLCTAFEAGRLHPPESDSASKMSDTAKSRQCVRK